MHPQINGKVSLICKVLLSYTVLYNVHMKSQEQGPLG